MKYTPFLTAAVVLSLSIVPAGYGLVPQPEQDPFTEQATNKIGSGSDQIVEGSKVTLQYVAIALGSSEIDYGNVSEFIQGRHEIFPALEREVVGMRPGEEKKVELSPGEGFGPHDDRKKLTIPKTLLPFGAKVGDVLRNDAGELATVG